MIMLATAQVVSRELPKRIFPSQQVNEERRLRTANHLITYS